jgi:inhibitor of KinA sporulation pathway (predicted exonuclease)
VIKFICFNFIKLSKMYKSIMNKENASKLWKMIQEAGDYLGG